MAKDSSLPCVPSRLPHHALLSSKQSIISLSNYNTPKLSPDPAYCPSCSNTLMCACPPSHVSVTELYCNMYSAYNSLMQTYSPQLYPIPLFQFTTDWRPLTLQDQDPLFHLGVRQICNEFTNNGYILQSWALWDASSISKSSI